MSGESGAIVDLLGPTLTKKAGSDETVETNTISGADRYVLLYFSAHWCPPCKAFTPKLIEFHKKFAEDKKFQVVFVSSDRDSGEFDTYFATMPWLALPFNDRDRKQAISAKFGITGIPVLVVLDAGTGEVVCKNARGNVTHDGELAADFPWRPPSLETLLSKLVKNGSEESYDVAKLGNDYIGLYFSASWCGPCKYFTPKLTKIYDKLKADGKKFEIIFVSLDRDKEAFAEYFSKMPWLATAFVPRTSELLTEKFEITGIPALIILDKSFNVITAKGTQALENDPEAAKYPWPTPACEELEDDHVDNTTPFCVLVAPSNSTADFEKVSKTLSTALDTLVASQGEDVKKRIRLTYCDLENETFEQLCSMTNVEGPAIGQMYAFDVSAQKVYRTTPTNDPDKVKDFVETFLKGEATGKTFHASNF